MGKIRQWFQRWFDKQIEMSFVRTANRMNRKTDLEREKMIAHWAEKKRNYRE